MSPLKYQNSKAMNESILLRNNKGQSATPVTIEGIQPVSLPQQFSNQLKESVEIKNVVWDALFSNDMLS